MDEGAGRDGAGVVARARSAARSQPARLGLAVLLLLGPWVHAMTAQPGSRFAFTAAVVEQGTVRIDDYAALTLPVDRVEVDGHLHSDKAPGQPLLAVPVLALAEAAGAEPATVLRFEGNLTLWWVTLWSSVVPAAVVAALMVVLARRHHPAGAGTAAAALALGTLLAPFGSLLYGHLPATAAGFGAWAVLADRPVTARRALLAGALAGAAVAIEYQLVLVAAVLAGWMFVRERGRLGWFVLGALPWAAGLVAYQQVVFGGLLSTPYSHKDVHAGAPAIAGVPDPAQLVEVLVGGRGLLVITPVVAVAVWGVVLGWRSGGAGREHAAVATAVLVGFVLLQAGWPNPWGGESPGPRYVLPALPFLAVPLAGVAAAHRRVVLATAAVGAVLVALPTITLHHLADGSDYVAGYRLNLDRFGVDPTVFDVAAGGAGSVALAACLAAGAVLVVQVLRADLGGGGAAAGPRGGAGAAGAAGAAR